MGGGSSKTTPVTVDQVAKVIDEATDNNDADISAEVKTTKATGVVTALTELYDGTIVSADNI